MVSHITTRAYWELQRAKATEKPRRGATGNAHARASAQSLFVDRENIVIGTREHVKQLAHAEELVKHITARTKQDVFKTRKPAEDDVSVPEPVQEFIDQSVVPMAKPTPTNVYSIMQLVKAREKSQRKATADVLVR